MSPDPTAKQGCPGGQAIALAGDRLSDLPDDLLHKIMSFLPAPQLVQTSVLSRRWRDLWRSTPCISIDQRDFRITACSGHHEREKKWRKLENFTTNFLLFHNNVASLDKFRIYTDSTHANALLLRDMDRWLRRGIKYCPQVLEILISCSRPPILFPHMGASSIRLKRLHLQGLYLEDLELRSCNTGFQEFKSGTLKRLVIDCSDNFTGDLVVITVPHVAYLRLGISPGCNSNGILIHELASLVKASIHLLCLGQTFSLKHQRCLLGNLCNVPNLELSGFQTMVCLPRHVSCISHLCCKLMFPFVIHS
ncbi:hypothetical protein ACQ4PT_010014 [Festuca glaucescens]